MRYNNKVLLRNTYLLLSSIGRTHPENYSNEQREDIKKWQEFEDKDKSNIAHLLAYHISCSIDLYTKKLDYDRIYHIEIFYCFAPLISTSVKLLNAINRENNFPIEEILFYNFYNEKAIWASLQVIFGMMRLGAEFPDKNRLEQYPSYLSVLKKEITHPECAICFFGSAIIGTLITHFKMLDKMAIALSVKRFAEKIQEEKWRASKSQEVLRRLDYNYSVFSAITVRFESQIIMQVRETLNKLSFVLLNERDRDFDPIQYLASLENLSHYSKAGEKNIIDFLILNYKEFLFNTRLKRVMPIVIKEILRQIEDGTRKERIIQDVFLESVGDQNCELAKLFIDLGACVNDGTYGYPLCTAISKEDNEMIKILLEAGAKPNLVSHNCDLALLCHVSSREMT